MKLHMVSFAQYSSGKRMLGFSVGCGHGEWGKEEGSRALKNNGELGDVTEL